MTNQTTLALSSHTPLRAASLGQMLFLYGLQAKDVEITINKMKAGENHHITLDVPDMPIFILGLKDCGITALPLPF